DGTGRTRTCGWSRASQARPAAFLTRGRLMSITGRGSRSCALKERGEVAKKGLAISTLQPRPPALKPPAAEYPAPGRLSSSPTLLILGPGQSSVKATLKNQHPIRRISSG